MMCQCTFPIKNLEKQLKSKNSEALWSLFVQNVISSLLQQTEFGPTGLSIISVTNVSLLKTMTQVSFKLQLAYSLIMQKVYSFFTKGVVFQEFLTISFFALLTSKFCKFQNRWSLLLELVRVDLCWKSFCKHLSGGGTLTTTTNKCAGHEGATGN